jgi:hypothetical protein
LRTKATNTQNRCLIYMILTPPSTNQTKINFTTFSKIAITAVLSCLLVVFLCSNRDVIRTKKISSEIKVLDSSSSGLYNTLKLGVVGLSKNAYTVAIKGFDSMRSSGILHNERILSIVDFSLPSFKKRLFIIDVVTGKLLYNTYVAHGRNSGNQFATKFSNQANSFQSSLGFYITGTTYTGHCGYSLRLQGMEVGINDNAFDRGIVMHAASYVYGGNSDKMGHAGRSEGCPAIPLNIHRAIIGLIKNGSCLFIYGSEKNYLAQSRFLRNPRVG